MNVARAQARIGAFWEGLWPSFRQTVIDGVSARYLCMGSGPPVLFVASPLTSARRYLPTMRALAGSFTVVCVELPGSGGSDKITGAWTVERYADWVIELVRRMPLAAPLVIGHAASARVALAIARAIPSEISGAILVEREGLGELAPRAVPDVVRNALRHRGTFVENMKTACAPPFSVRGAALAPNEAPVFRIGAEDRAVADVQAFGRAVRRFFASARRAARNAAAVPALGVGR